MPDYKLLKMADLLLKLRSDIVSIEESRDVKLFKQAGKDLNDVYTFHLSAKNSFAEVEHYLKNLYKSYNYASAIINDALKKKTLGSDNAVHLDECIEMMITCCDVIIPALTKNKK